MAWVRAPPRPVTPAELRHSASVSKPTPRRTPAKAFHSQFFDPLLLKGREGQLGESPYLQASLAVGTQVGESWVAAVLGGSVVGGGRVRRQQERHQKTGERCRAHLPPLLQPSPFPPLPTAAEQPAPVCARANVEGAYRPGQVPRVPPPRRPLASQLTVGAALRLPLGTGAPP